MEQIDKEIDEALEKTGKYIKMKDKEVLILQFDPEQVEKVFKDYKGDGNEKIKFEYTVLIPGELDEEGNPKEKIFSAAPKFAKRIQARFKRKQTLLEVERFGTDKNTDYTFTPVS